jgi:NAD(P)-dependent dehydrogenase (short-subunit alcohol dehydrogenase family)
VTPVRGDVANLDDLDLLYTTIKTAAKRLDIVVANAAFHAIGRCPTERLREPVNEGVYPS